MIFSTTFLVSLVILVSFYSGIHSQSLNEPVPVGPLDMEKVRRIEAAEAEKRDDSLDSDDFCATLDILPDIENEEEAKNAVTFDRFLWKGTFDVFLDPDWQGDPKENDLARDIFHMEMSYLQEIFGDCMQFRIYPEGATAPKGDYVHVYRGDLCASEKVGRKGGKQCITFADMCNHRAAILHELMHALGLHHEQNRPDRDDYITVYWDNIKPEFKRQFNKVDPKFFGTYDVPYDYKSQMHYSKYAFSKNFEPTLIAKSGNEQWVGGSRLGNMTEFDMLKLRRMYKCGD